MNQMFFTNSENFEKICQKIDVFFPKNGVFTFFRPGRAYPNFAEIWNQFGKILGDFEHF